MLSISCNVLSIRVAVEECQLSMFHESPNSDADQPDSPQKNDAQLEDNIDRWLNMMVVV